MLAYQSGLDWKESNDENVDGRAVLPPAIDVPRIFRLAIQHTARTESNR